LLGGIAVVVGILAVILTDGVALVAIGMVAGLVGATGAGIGAASILEVKSDMSEAPGITLAALDGTGGITWTGAKKFSLQSVALNDSLQLNGELLLWGRPRMRYPASEKLEIIRLIEESHLSARLTLAKLGIPRTTFYRWYDRYASTAFGPANGSFA